MTKEEKHLWYDFLRKHPVKILRQKVIGRYIADFYCAKANLIIEIDGSQHYEEKGIEYDLKRDAFLAEYGLKVLRIQNIDVNRNFEGVCQYIAEKINEAIK